jgi:hypothetical protein
METLKRKLYERKFICGSCNKDFVLVGNISNCITKKGVKEMFWAKYNLNLEGKIYSKTRLRELGLPERLCQDCVIKLVPPAKQKEERKREAIHKEIAEMRVRSEKFNEEQKKAVAERKEKENEEKRKLYFNVIYRNGKTENILGIDDCTYANGYINILDMNGVGYAIKTYDISGWKSNLPDIHGLFRYCKRKY